MVLGYRRLSGRCGGSGEGTMELAGQPRPPRRDPLHELRDYPFFRPEGDAPAPSWLARHGPAVALALAYLVAALLMLTAAVILAW